MKRAMGTAGLSSAVAGKGLLAFNIPPAPTTLPLVQGLTSTGGIQNLAYTVLNWIFWGLIVFSVVMALVAAYKYVTSGGEPEKVRSAGKTLMYAAIGVVVALLASAIPIIIGTFFGVGVNF